MVGWIIWPSSSRLLVSDDDNDLIESGIDEIGSNNDFLDTLTTPVAFSTNNI